MTYGNTTSDLVTYDAKLQPATYTLNNVNYQNSNVPSAPINYTSMSWSYDYYDDGRLHHAYDSTNNWFDRAYAYDHVGRLTEATTYRRAEGLSPVSAPDPYQQTTSYDAWNNSSRTGYLYGGGPFADEGNYSNNRHQNFGYDADGNVTNSGSYHNTIDAAGKQAQVVSGLQTVGNGTTQFPTQPAIDISQGYDGDGRPRNRVQIARQNIYDDTNQNHPLVQVLEDPQVSYYVTSSVLGGANVMQLRPDGQGGAIKKTLWIYAGGQRIAVEENGSVNFEHHNPATGSWVITLGHSSYRTASREERDPVGAETPTSNPYPLTPTYVENKWGEPLFIDGGDPFDYCSGSTIDGLPVSASEFSRRTESGSVGAGVFFKGRPIGFIDLAGQSSHVSAAFDVFRSLTPSDHPDFWRYLGSFSIDFSMPDSDAHEIEHRGGSPQSRYPSPGSNGFPTLSGDSLKEVNSALESANDATDPKNHPECDQALKTITKGAISSLAALVSQFKPNVNLFDGRRSTLGIVYANVKPTTLGQFFREQSSAIGAMVVPNHFTGIGDVAFLNSYFFNPAQSGFMDQQRALILIHEAVHQFGHKDDPFFGSSRNLTTMIAQKCFPGLNAAKLLGNLTL